MTESSNTQLALSVNHPITEAITQVNVNALAEAPAMAMGSLYQAVEMNVDQSVKAGQIVQGGVLDVAQATQAMMHYSQSVMQYCLDPFGMYGQMMSSMSSIGSTKI